jgi:hypothetical protein
MFGTRVSVSVREGDLEIAEQRSLPCVDIPTCLAGCLSETTSRPLAVLAKTAGMFDDRMTTVAGDEVTTAEAQFLLSARQLCDAWEEFDKDFMEGL